MSKAAKANVPRPEKVLVEQLKELSLEEKEAQGRNSYTLQLPGRRF